MKRGPKSKKFTSSAPKIDRSDTPSPAHLDERAKAVWELTVGDVTSRPGFNPADLFILEIYCSQYSAWLDAEAKLAVEGKVIVFKSGYQQTSKWFDISRDAQKQIVSLSNTLGLNPAARAKLKSLVVTTPASANLDKYFE